jgi:hypothetical protein
MLIRIKTKKWTWIRLGKLQQDKGYSKLQQDKGLVKGESTGSEGAKRRRKGREGGFPPMVFRGLWFSEERF